MALQDGFEGRETSCWRVVGDPLEWGRFVVPLTAAPL